MNYYLNKYKKRKRRKTKVLLSIFLCVILLIVFYYHYVVNPVVLQASQHMIFSLSTSAVSDAIYDVLSEENLSYEDFVHIEKDDNGDVKLISLQTMTLNMIARKFYQVAQVYLDNMGRNGVDIALGTFSGIPLLAGVGPKVNVKLVSIGAMTSTFESKFKNAGINQTNHSLYIHLYASVSMVLPSYNQTIDSVTEMLVAENVIVGQVPQVYLGGSSSLSFTPN